MNHQYLAVVETSYTTYAIADTKQEARKLALKSARNWLKLRGVEYKSLKELEETLGCNVFKIPKGEAIQEY